jgi:hypothetical protein
MADDKKVVFSLELDTRALKKNAKEAEVALVDLVEKQKTLRKEQKTNTVEYVQLTEEIRINQKALKDNAQALQIQESLAGKTELTNKELMLVQKALAVEYNNLTEEQRENTLEGQKTAKQYKDVNDALNQNSLAVGDGRRNVGLYKQAIIDANKEINGLKKEVSQIGFEYGKTSSKIDENTKALKSMSDAGDTTSAEFKQLEQETIALNETLIFQENALKGATEELNNQEKALEKTTEEARKIGFVYGESQLTLKDIKQELKDVTNEMLNMEKGSPAYIEASKRAGDLRDKLIDVKNAQKEMVGDTGFEKMGASMSSMKNSLMNLNFEEASEKAKQLQNIAGNMTFKEVIGGAKNLGSTLVSLGKTILTNPLFLLVAVITAVVGALVMFAGSTRDVTAENDALNASLEKQNDALNRLNDKAKRNSQNRLELARAQGASEKEILKITLDNIDEEEQRRQKSKSNLRQEINDRQKLYYAALEEDDEELAKKIKGEINNTRKKYKDLKNLDGQYLIDKQILTTASETKEKEENDKKNEEIRKANKDAYKKRLDDQEKAVQDRLALEKDTIQKLRDLYLSAVNITNENERKLLDKKYETLELMAKGNLQTLLKLQEEKNAESLILDEKEKQAEKQALENSYKDQLSGLDEQIKKLSDLKKLANQKELQEINKLENKILEEKLVLEKNKILQLESIDIDYNNKRAEGVQAVEDIIENIKEEKSLNSITQMEADLQREINILKKRGLSEAQIFENTKQAQIDIETEKNSQIQANELLSLEERYKAQQDFDAKIIELNKQSADAEIEIDKNKKEKIIEASQFALDQISAISNAFFEVAQSNINKEIEASQRKEDKLSNDLQARLTAGIISEEQYAIEKQKIDEESQAQQKKLQKEAFEIQKKSQLSNAILSGASAVLQALASSPPPYSYVLAGITAGLTGVQIGIISRQEPPEFAEGGLTGQLITNTDGKPISRANGDNLLATVKTGEIITNKKQQKYIEAVAGSDIWSRAGVKGFASGGFTGSEITNKIDAQNDTSRIVIDALKNIPTPIVLVQDIVDAQTNLAKVEDSANY